MAYLEGLDIELRLANKLDAELLFKWRNLNEIVSLSALQKTVTWNEHKNWFTHALVSTKLILIIIVKNKIPIGQVRFNKISNEECKISIYLIPTATGYGLGGLLIHQACKQIHIKWPQITRVKAEVRKENSRSMKAFTKAGFKILNNNKNQAINTLYEMVWDTGR